jgi:C-terminal processing protease CtpA/Prc
MSAQSKEKTQPRAWLGVAVQDVNEKTAKKNNMADACGAYVSDVTDESPADSAGIQKGDVIVEFGTRQIEDASDLVKAVGKSKVGDKVSVVFLRKGDKKTIQITLRKYSPSNFEHYAPAMSALPFRVFENMGSQGMRLMELNEQLGEYFAAPGGTGVLVEQVDKESAAEKAGIKAGDVLLKIGKRTIDDLEDVSRAFARQKEGDKVDVQVLRKGTQKNLSLEVAENRESGLFNIFRGRPGRVQIFRTPPFEGNMYETPGWNGEELRLKLEELRPHMDVLEENINKMRKELDLQKKDVVKPLLRHVLIRTV